MGSALDLAFDPPLGLTAREHRRLADVLLKAARDRRPIAPLCRRYPELTLADALRIRDALAERRVAGGETRIGAALSSGGRGRAQPSVGWICSGMLLDADEVDVRPLIRPRVEAVIACRLARPLHGARVGEAELNAATGGLAPGLLVLDSRYEGEDLTAADDVADNCAVTLLRLAADVAPPDHGPTAFAGEVELDGGTPHAATATPVAQLREVAAHLVSSDTQLEAGTLLVCPVGGPSAELVEGTRIRACWDDLGVVELHATHTDNQEALR